MLNSINSVKLQPLGHKGHKQKEQNFHDIEVLNLFLFLFFGGCVGQSFAYVAHFYFCEMSGFEAG
jgi:hypothetical protein